MYPTKEGDSFLNKLPLEGASTEQIFKKLEAYKTASEYVDGLWKSCKHTCHYAAI